MTIANSRANDESGANCDARANEIEAVVCIPTFRRPGHLFKTLTSMVAQETSTRFAVVVVENDAGRCEGRAIAREFLARSLTGLCVVEARQGNCHAINRAFASAREAYPRAEFLLMIDDDEVADPAWLGRMLGAARATGADVVGGPVIREFEAHAGAAIRLHPLFNCAMTKAGFVAQLHGSGNCLIRRRVFERLPEPSFDLRFNHLGGGDMDFFTRCRLAGFKTYWIEDAVAFETVPVQRMRLGWLLRRGLHTGVINYTIDRKRHASPFGALRMGAKNLASLPVALLRAAALLAKTRRLPPALHPIAVSIGRNLAPFGLAPAPYKSTNIPLTSLSAPLAARAD